MPNTSSKLDNSNILFPSDTTANRPGAAGGTYAAQTAVAGMIRFNITNNYMEYYDGTAWQAITAPPIITSISPTYYASSGDVITISGSNFSTSPTVTLTSKTGTSYTSPTVTYVSNSSVTFTIPSGLDTDANDPFDVKIINSSGLSYTLLGGLSRTTNPTFTTASGSIGTVYDSLRSAYSFSAVTATDAESDVSLTYAITSGAAATGLTLSSSGTWSGTISAVASDTTYNFTVTATGTDSSNSGNTVSASRAFSITVKAPVVTSFTATGANTFSVPTGISSVWVVAIAGGGSGGNGNGSSGGGGAGGMIEMPAFPVTPGGSVPLSVGAGASPGTAGSDVNGNQGTPTTFGTLTAIGGGYGGGWSSGTGGGPGGSGGGGSTRLTTAVGTGTQPSQPGNSGTYGYGYPGGTANSGPYIGGGGGGAAAAGFPYTSNGNGGTGRTTSITTSSVTYAGGGGGAGEYYAPIRVIGGIGGPGGGGAGGNAPTNPGGVPGVPGTTNRGGGGGSGTWDAPPPIVYTGGSGGPGIVIVRY